MKKNAFGQEHIKTGRCRDAITRDVTTREGPAGLGDARNHSARPGRAGGRGGGGGEHVGGEPLDLRDEPRQAGCLQGPVR